MRLLPLLLVTALAGCGLAQPPAAAPRAGALAASAADGFYNGAHFLGTTPLTDDDAGKEDLEGADRSLPTRVDLRDEMPPIYDQGPMSSCTGFAVACGLGEYLLKQEGRPTHLSARYVYWQARKQADPRYKSVTSTSRDSGAQIADAVDALDNLGACPEEAFAYPSVAGMRADRGTVAGLAAIRPPADAVAAAKKFRPIRGKTAVKSLRALRKSLAAGMPVVCGMLMYPDFRSDAVKKTGRVPLPNPAKEAMIGGHAVLVVGYDMAKRELLFRNSWGAEWGDKGYFTLPMAALKLRDPGPKDPNRPDGYHVLYDAWAAKR